MGDFQNIERDKSKTFYNPVKAHTNERINITNTEDEEINRHKTQYVKDNKKEDEKYYNGMSGFSNDNTLPIQVINPIKKEGMKVYMLYTIKLKDKNEVIYRRYSDFFSLREVFITRWP